MSLIYYPGDAWKVGEECHERIPWFPKPDNQLQLCHVENATLAQQQMETCTLLHVLLLYFASCDISVFVEFQHFGLDAVCSSTKAACQQSFESSVKLTATN